MNPNNSKAFSYAWQYIIDPGKREEFLAAYRPGGEWCRLFERDPAYLRTLLFQDADDADRYMTIDFWQSKAARDNFIERHSGEFKALDRQCEGFTRSEELLGDFYEVAGADD